MTIARQLAARALREARRGVRLAREGRPYQHVIDHAIRTFYDAEEAADAPLERIGETLRRLVEQAAKAAGRW